MNRRLLILVVTTLPLFLACSPTSAEKLLPTTTTIPPATDTAAPVTQTSTAVSFTETSESQSVVTTDWINQLEVIRARNWTRLQLLKTFPAEMPLQHSAVAIALNGKTMAVGSSTSAQILFFDLPAGQLSRTMPVNGVANPDAYFNVIEYLSDGSLMANSAGPYMIYHIDADGKVLSAWGGISFATSADKRIMAQHTDEGITLVEIANNTTVVSLEEQDGMYFSFSPNGSRIAVETITVDAVNTVIWDIANQTRLSTLMDAANARFSPDGKFLAVTSYAESTNPLKIFSPDGATEITTLQVNDPNGLNGRAPLWSLDGSILAAEVGYSPVVAWDTTSWQSLNTPALQGDLYAFSPDGRILITRTSDGGILLYGVLP